jgi:CubicO group peptidase (beta-lactamase class C family)
MKTTIHEDIPAKLQSRVKVFEEILSITGQPAISIAVVHHKSTIFECHSGKRDIALDLALNGDTIYCIASLTKAFITTALAILVAETDLTWETPVLSILPQFKTSADGLISEFSTLSDILSHRTGLNSLDQLTQGIQSQTTLSFTDTIQFLRASPSNGKFRACFDYCNILYSVAGMVIEKTAKVKNWADFLEDPIWKPLQMNRTTASRAVHESDSNVAKPYLVGFDGEPVPTCYPMLSKTSINGPAGGIRSSVSDLAKWCQYILATVTSLEEEHHWQRLAHDVRKNIMATMSAANIIDPEFVGDEHYCMGWVRQTTPARLGQISPNRKWRSPLLGKDSYPITIYSHQGNFDGYTSSLYLVPSDDFGVVVLTNGTGLSDATDWIAQDVLQTVFELQPSIDFISEAKISASPFRNSYKEDFRKPWEDGKVQGTQQPPTSDYVGRYTLRDANFVLDIKAEPGCTQRMLLTVNQREFQTHCLQHYHFDVWTFMPETEEGYYKGGYGVFETWLEFLITFSRGYDGLIAGVKWHMHNADIYFDKK